MATTKNKQTVETYMEGFRSSDHEKILSCLTDDVVWEMPGIYKHVGKEAFDKEIENENFVGSPAIQITRLVEEQDVVIAEGCVQGEMKNGGRLDAVFCDVFLMRDGKIKQLTSYLMSKNASLKFE
ncbi:MAG: nuclear transport factor 2 family protein [Agriterribacter sp.]